MGMLRSVEMKELNHHGPKPGCRHRTDLTAVPWIKQIDSAFLCANLCGLCVEIRASEVRTMKLNAKDAEVLAKERRGGKAAADNTEETQNQGRTES